MSRAILAFALINALAGIAIALNRVHYPNEAFWVGKDGWIFFAIIVVGLLPLLQSGISELGERKRRKKAELAQTLQELLAVVLIDLNRNAGADWKLTGVQVFRTRRWWVFWEIQARLAKLRLAHVAPSGIKWKRRKGLIGKCWETGRPQSANLHEHFEPYSKLDKVMWDTLPQVIDKFGLTYEEFRKVYDKYGLVVAFPLTAADKYIGCITADMPPEYSASVDEAKVRETLSAAAPSISAVIVKEG